MCLCPVLLLLVNSLDPSPSSPGLSSHTYVAVPLITFKPSELLFLSCLALFSWGFGLARHLPSVLFLTDLVPFFVILSVSHPTTWVLGA